MPSTEAEFGEEPQLVTFQVLLSLQLGVVCNVAGSLEVNLFTSPEATGLDVCYCGCYSVLPLSQTDFPASQILIGSADS